MKRDTVNLIRYLLMRRADAERADEAAIEAMYQETGGNNPDMVADLIAAAKCSHAAETALADFADWAKRATLGDADERLLAAMIHCTNLRFVNCEGCPYQRDPECLDNMDTQAVALIRRLAIEEAVV